MKKRRPKQHVRKVRVGKRKRFSKKVLVNKGIKYKRGKPGKLIKVFVGGTTFVQTKKN